ncbi:hypothetical protein ASL20_01925 [Cupriavidus necator]|uniref:hypothetical protein n=1 Tax=Cupriavidus necator TaxID=106590 RepID=UPI000735A3D3|nr:hypothetical protein [Cupriavidus necator]KUE90640.1 hypothetical protein ASL20_01925 [Cupriavidus necator]
MPLPLSMPLMTAASHLVQAYSIANIQHGQVTRLTGYGRPILDAAYDAADELRACCDRKYQWLVSFLDYLRPSQFATIKVDAIKRINAAFNITASALPEINSLSRWKALGEACARVAQQDRIYLDRFYRTRNARSALSDIEEIFYTANKEGMGDDALRVMKAVMQNGGNAAGITSRTIVALARMLHAHPPLSGFMGYTRWGPGDHGNPDANLRAHALKHVCRQPLLLEVGVAETMFWWDFLRIQLTLADYNRLAVNPKPLVQSLFDGVNPLAGDHLRRFLIHQAFNDEPQLADFALQQALRPYRDVAIETSRVLNRVIIQSNGEKVFLSGASGNIFIIGRFEGTELGISSCYWATDIESKLRGARSNICWEVRR